MPNALAFIATALTVAGIGSALWDPATGALAGLVYATSPFPAIAANAVSTDTLLTLWELLAVFAYLRAVRQEHPRVQRFYVALMWAAFGLGCFTKGPVALLPLLAIAVWHRRQQFTLRLLTPLGFALFLSVGIGWYLYEGGHHAGLLSYFVGDEVLARVATSRHHRNPQWYKPLILYVPPLLAGGGLWAGLALLAAWRSRVLQERGPGIVRPSGAAWFVVLWLTIPLIVLCLAKSRLVLYVLPLYAPVALATARLLATARPPLSGRNAVWGAALASFVLLIGTKKGVAVLPYRNNAGQLYEFCKVPDGQRALYFLYNKKGHFSLQFYTQGRVKHVTDGGGEDWADTSLRAAIAEVQASSDPERAFVFVAARSDIDRVRQALTQANFSYDVAEDRYWAYCRISGRAAESAPARHT